MSTNEFIATTTHVILSTTNEDVLAPVTEGGEAHGGGDECHSPGEGGVTTEEEGEHTAHTH